jgi:hypothetical protein
MLPDQAAARDAPGRRGRTGHLEGLPAESVAEAVHGPQERGSTRHVAQGLPDLPHQAREVGVGYDGLRPQAVPQLRLGQGTRATLQERAQEVEGLRRDVNGPIRPLQFPAIAVVGPVTEPKARLHRAAFRPRRVSSASYTTPMPPPPSLRRTRWCEIVSPIISSGGDWLLDGGSYRELSTCASAGRPAFGWRRLDGPAWRVAARRFDLPAEALGARARLGLEQAGQETGAAPRNPPRL